MKKIIVFMGYNTHYVDNFELSAYVMDLDEKGWNELSSTLLNISYKIKGMINECALDVDKAFKGVKLPFKKELKFLYKKHGSRINWHFLPYKGNNYK